MKEIPLTSIFRVFRAAEKSGGAVAMKKKHIFFVKKLAGKNESTTFAVYYHTNTL